MSGVVVVCVLLLCVCCVCVEAAGGGGGGGGGARDTESKTRTPHKVVGNEKNPRKIAIFHFLENFCTTGNKNDKNMIKNDKQMKKTRGKLQFSIFWKIFAPLEAKMMKHDIKNYKNDKQMKKNDKEMKKLEENCNFSFFAEFLHHWKQK